MYGTVNYFTDTSHLTLYTLLQHNLHAGISHLKRNSKHQDENLDACRFDGWENINSIFHFLSSLYSLMSS